MAEELPLARSDKRSGTQIRGIKLFSGGNPFADSHVEVHQGLTRLLISAVSDTNSGKGISTNVRMLPHATPIRERSTEFATAEEKELRLIASMVDTAMRASIGASDLGTLSIALDITIISTDGGVASAAVAGSWLALYQALQYAAGKNLVPEDLEVTRVAAVSIGVLSGKKVLDLHAEETAQAEFRGVVLCDAQQRVIEVNAAEVSSAIDSTVFSSLVAEACVAAKEIFAEQERAVSEQL